MTAPNPNNVVAYYTFDENTGTTAFDSTPNGNDGTLLGGVTWVSGILNSGIETDTTKAVRAQPSAFGNNDFSYSTWIYPTTTGGNSVSFVSGGATSISLDNRWFLAQDNQQVRVWLNFEGPSTRVSANTDDVLTLNQWNHVVLTRNGTTAKIYVNGVEEGSYNVFNWNIWGNNNLFIGGLDEASNINAIRIGFPGRIDETSLFNKSLNSAEVGFLYASGAPNSNQQYPFSDPVEKIIDWSNGQMQKVIIGTNGVEFSFLPPRGVGRFDLRIIHDNSSPINLFFPSNVIFPTSIPNWSTMGFGEQCVITFRYDSDDKYVAVPTPFFVLEQ